MERTNGNFLQVFFRSKWAQINNQNHESLRTDSKKANMWMLIEVIIIFIQAIHSYVRLIAGVQCAPAADSWSNEAATAELDHQRWWIYHRL